MTEFLETQLCILSYR